MVRVRRKNAELKGGEGEKMGIFLSE